MNNNGGSTDLQNYPPDSTSATPPGPGYPGQSDKDRYNAIPVSSLAAQAIAANSPSGLIDFDFVCACIWSGPNQNCYHPSSTQCHQDVSWVRVVKDLNLSTEEVMYNDCPVGNFITGFDPCA